MEHGHSAVVQGTHGGITPDARIQMGMPTRLGPNQRSKALDLAEEVQAMRASILHLHDRIGGLEETLEVLPSTYTFNRFVAWLKRLFRRT